MNEERAPGMQRGVTQGLLVTHGSLGKELLQVVESILGPQDGVRFVTNTGASAEGLQRQIDDLLREMEPGPILVFVDLLGGSCGQVCLSVQRNHPEVSVVSGVNLPMLLEFAYKRNLLDPRELLSQVLRKGREGILCLPTQASS